MSPPPASRPRPRDGAKPIDDFEWPPTGDDLSVYEIEPDPGQTRQTRRARCSRRAGVSGRSRAAAGRQTAGGTGAADDAEAGGCSRRVGDRRGCRRVGALRGDGTARDAASRPSTTRRPRRGDDGAAAEDQDRRDLPGRTGPCERCARGVAGRRHPQPAAALRGSLRSPRRARRRGAVADGRPGRADSRLRRVRSAGRPLQSLRHRRLRGARLRRLRRQRALPPQRPGRRRAGRSPSTGRSTSPAQARSGASPDSALTDASLPPAGGAPPSSDWVRGPRTQERS